MSKAQDPPQGTPRPRKGRGALSSPKPRFAEHDRVAVDDGWQDDCGSPRRGDSASLRGGPGGAGPAHPPAPGLGAQHPVAQRLPGRPLRPLHQPVPRLPARLYLLLCAPEPRLSRALSGARFRDGDLLQTRGAGPAAGGAGAARLPPSARRPGVQHRCLSAERTAAAHHPRPARRPAPDPPSGRGDHQVRPGPARPRPPRGPGPGATGRGPGLHHDAGPAARPASGAPGVGARPTPGGHRGARRRRRTVRGPGLAGHSRPHGPRDRADPGRGGAGRGQPGQPHHPAPAPGAWRALPGLAQGPLPRSGRPRS